MKKVALLSFSKVTNSRWYLCEIQFSYRGRDYTHLKEDGLNLLFLALKINLHSRYKRTVLLPSFLTTDSLILINEELLYEKSSNNKL